jgi:hypothetical protein
MDTSCERGIVGVGEENVVDFRGAKSVYPPRLASCTSARTCRVETSTFACRLAKGGPVVNWTALQLLGKEGKAPCPSSASSATGEVGKRDHRYNFPKS